MRMRIHRSDGAIGFNVWTVQGTWFWSLVYPDQHGGAIGAAASEAEAIGEAQAAIERLPHERGDIEIELEHCNDQRLARWFQNSKDSQSDIGCMVDSASGDFACSRAAWKRISKMRIAGESYNDLWQLTLRQYAARVAAV
jgi:hypothetical protein